MVSACRASSSTSPSVRLSSRCSLGSTVDELRRPAHLGVLGVDHLGRLRPHPPLEDRRPARPQSRLVDVELVRVDRPLHHPLPQPVRRGDEHRLVEAGLGVHREHHPGRPDVGANHPLHPRRQRHRLVRRTRDAPGRRSPGRCRATRTPPGPPAAPRRRRGYSGTSPAAPRTTHPADPPPSRDDRTANDSSASSPDQRPRTPARMSASRSAGNGCSITAARTR